MQRESLTSKIFLSTGDIVALPGSLESGENTPSSSSEGKKAQPTEKELRECRHVKNSLSRSVWFVALLGLCERFAYYGIIVMFRE